MRKVRRIRREGQTTELIAAEMDAPPVDAATIDAKVALIQALIPVGLVHVAESLHQELEILTGPRYARHGGQPGLVRHGRQAGSVHLADQSVTEFQLRMTLTPARGQYTGAEMGRTPSIGGYPTTSTRRAQ